MCVITQAKDLNWIILCQASCDSIPFFGRFLLDLGADPNRKGQYGRTPLYRAAFCGHLEAVKVRAVKYV